MPESRTIALLMAAGHGVRGGGGVPKQFRDLGGRSMLARAYEALRSHPSGANSSFG